MSNDDWSVIQDLYQKGLDLDGPDRNQLLQECCPGESELHLEVEALWANSREDDPIIDFGSLPTMAMKVFLDRVVGKDRSPDRVRSYRILKRIARGGMAEVYQAEQQLPIQRMVALKVLPAMLASTEYFQRFQAEQRALALMAHRNIASVFDAGVNEDGRPFFTMEYLDAMPITDYCDHKQLTVRQRLDLFCQVCDGVQHAHQRGVIHRDLHPGNILVDVQDGHPVPKIIDFGLAKLTDQTLLETPVQTRIGTIMGTPPYLSPEQAGGKLEESLDTRTDIYSLGVLFFEILVGQTPFDRELKEAGSFREWCRIVQEKQASLPSASMETSESGRVTAANRKTSPERLRKIVSGDLDRIAVKALAREPEQRFGSCSEFRADIRFFLEGLPVTATPPGAWYLLRKYVQRHKKAVLAGGLGLALLCTAFLVSLVLLFKTRAAEYEAETALRKMKLINAYSITIFNQANPKIGGRDVKVVDLLETSSQKLGETYREEPDLEATMRLVLGRSFLALGLTKEAMFELTRALFLFDRLDAQNEERLDTLLELAFAHAQLGNLDQALSYYRQAESSSSKLAAPNPYWVLTAKSGIAYVLAQKGQSEKAKSIFDEVLAIQDVTGNKSQTTATRNNFANLAYDLGNYEQAEQMHRLNLTIRKKTLHPDHPSTFSSMHNLARALQKLGRNDEAETYYLEALEGRQSEDPNHPDTIDTLSSYAEFLGASGRLKEAVILLENRLIVEHESLPKDTASVHIAMHGLGNLLSELGEHERADFILCRTLDQKLDYHGFPNKSTLVTRVTLAQNLLKMGKPEDAEPIFRDAAFIAERVYPEDHPQAAYYHGLLCACLIQTGKHDEAELLPRRSLKILSKTQSSFAREIKDYLDALTGV